MADSFFTSFLRPSENTIFNHKQRLITQREDAVNYAKKLEMELKRSTEQFNLRYKAFQSQVSDLEQQNLKSESRIKLLQQQNKAKDQLLNGNSKVIMRKTTEIIRLKDEIKELNEKLKRIKNTKSLKLPLKSSHSLPLQITVSNPQKTMSPHKKEPNKPLPSPPTPLHIEIQRTKSDSISEMHQLPFIHRKTGTHTSSLSETAVNLSLPEMNSGNTLSINASMNPIKKPLQSQLSPICELKSRDDNSLKTKNNLSLIKISDDNNDITNEWGQSICNDSNDSANDSSDNVSLMSDNTAMYDSLLLAKHIKNKKSGVSLSNVELMSAGHFSQKSSGNLEGCDVVQSPVTVFSINHSFRIVLNDKTQKSAEQKSYDSANDIINVSDRQE